ncbi:MAG: discoidin domain-containing protein [Candidatus Binatia bacterium]
MSTARWVWTALALALGALAYGPAQAIVVLDTFERLDGWTAVASRGALVEMAQDSGPTGMALRVDFEFPEVGGHVLVRKAINVKLPANYAFTYRIRATAPPVDFEFKLIDSTDQNVWWYREHDTVLPGDWTIVRIKKPRLQFAWGPLSGGQPRDIAAVEFAITGAAGDKGSVWVDNLALEERPMSARAPAPPRATASTSAPGADAARALDADLHSGWMSGSLAAEQWLMLDFGQAREYGGLIIEWDDADYAVSYQVMTSDDGANWAPAYRCTRGNGERDYIYLPDGESRFVRLDLQQSSRGEGYGIRELSVIPLELAASPNQFFESMARAAPAGTYPKYFSGQQSYWTILGADGDRKEAALNEEGMLEVARGAFSIEPFLWSDGSLITWHDVQTEQSLEDGYLPIPTVTWFAGPLSLAITAFVYGEPGQSILLARYRLDNTSDTARDVNLFLAVRPFQVLPPWQTLNMVGGVSPIRDLVFDARALHVNRDWSVFSLTPPTQVGATTFDEGQVAEMLLDGVLPRRLQVSDPMGYASAALGYTLRLAPQEREEVYLAIPYYDVDAAMAKVTPEGAAVQVSRGLATTAAAWRRRLGCVDFTVPPSANDIERTVKSTLAYILINRDDDAIQPGSRTYARSWIRDGAMTSAALLQLGMPGPVRQFLPWYARYQYPDGKIPCCVDRHGPDPLPEHDSNGEFLFALAEYYRYTRDIGLVHELWPHATAAVDYLEGLRAQRLTPQYAEGDRRVFYGLLPESVSHEGYAAHPVHSYWDDFFALRGLKDAVRLATAVGDEAQATRIAALRDGLQRDLHASIARVIETRGLDYVPASAELADFDPSATAAALYPGEEQSRLPPAALARTFERYHAELRQRGNGNGRWEAYSPYELRTVSALVRLGQREAAFDVLGRLLEGRRPKGWNQWAEIVWRDPTAPKFIGDMPHTWVGSGFIEAIRTMFAYEREDDGALVLGAGLPRAWIEAEGGAGVGRLPTYYGVITYRVSASGASTTRMEVSGDAISPPGGVVLAPPLPGPLRSATVNGRPVGAAGQQIVIHQLPADVVMEH